MKINPKVYDTCKYLAMVGLPALATFIAFVGPEWDFPKVDAITKTLTGLGTLLGALVVVNQVQYNRSDARFDGTLEVQVTPHGQDNEIVHMDVDPTVNEITDKGEVLMKVVPQKE